MKYKILSHTADLRLEVYGKTIEELFINAVEAIANILSGDKKSLLSYMIAAEKIEISSNDQNTLLVDFLNEILAKSNINKAIYKVDKIVIASRAYRQAGGAKQCLSAQISRAPVDKFEEDVKAVTYHEVNIKKEKDIYETRLVLDI
jgi:SHS2 domain-containing protein